MKKNSLRQQAKILGVSHPYLSQMINGRRPWNAEIKARYEELSATTFATTRVVNSAESVQNVANTTRKEPYIAEVISSTLIPLTIMSFAPKWRISPPPPTGFL